MPNVAELYDAVVVGSGPNGFGAAITLAKAGRKVLLVEAMDELGGGMRSAELTIPGYIHDVCSAVHPLAVGSPFFRDLPLAQFGLEWIWSPAELAHAFDDGTTALMFRSVDETATQFGKDADAYRRLFGPLAERWDKLADFLLGPPIGIPKHPILTALFGLQALRPATSVAEGHFKTDDARAFFSGLAAHSILPLGKPLSASFGLVLGALGHTVGWPIPKGGSQSIANALAGYLRSLGGEVQTGINVKSLSDLPKAKAYLFDTSPASLVKIAVESLNSGYRTKLEAFEYGPGVFKMDWALSEPIPWKDPRCAQAVTVHLAGTYADFVRSEKEPWENRPPEKPFVLLAQPSLFDPTRAPEGRHTAWAYCHVPNGSEADFTDVLEGQIERMAPGFRDLILARSKFTAAAYERYNPNLVGGDVGGGANTLAQIFGRPMLSPSPYRTPNPSLFLCSAATPPGGGVHGMCGMHAANAALKGILR